MVSVGPMEPSGDQVIDVIAMRNRLVSAFGAVGVDGVAVDRIGVVARMLLIDRDRVLVNVLLVRVVQMAVVEVVDVIAVADGRVATARAMLVRVGALMDLVGHGPDLRTPALVWQAPPHSPSGGG